MSYQSQDFGKMLQGCGFSLSSIIYLQQIYWECGRRGGVHFPTEAESKYICMKLPKTYDNDRTHKIYANTLS